MAQDQLEEMLQFLKPDSRIDLKHISLEYLLGLSGSENGINLLLQNERIMLNIIDLTNDRQEETAKNALSLLMNVSANEKGAAELLKYKPSCKKNVVESFICYVLDQQKKDADIACMILSNITTHENLVNVCIDTFLKYLNDILNVFANVNYNKRGSNLHYLAPMLGNLSVSSRIRKWVTEENPHVPLIKLLPFCNFTESTIRRGGVISVIRNLSFDTEYHEFLLSNELELLSYLLLPLMGNEEYVDEEMDQLPISLQYLPKEKQREGHTEIRKLIIETLNKLCAKRNCREILRENGVYYILREYHKWEKDASLLLACENVVDILIQKESEVGADDLTKVEVPEDMTERFQKMDEDYVNNVQ